MSKLSLSLSKYSLANLKLVGQVKKGLVAIDPILSQIQTHSVTHGGSMRQVNEPVKLETTMQKHSVTINLEKECFLKTDSSIFGGFLFGLCDSFISEQKRYLFDVVSKVTEATGNVFDVQGRNIWDAMLEMVRSMAMCFDEEGNHNHQFYINPETSKKLRENPPTPEQEKAMEELIKSKKQEYYAQKRIRRLS